MARLSHRRPFTLEALSLAARVCVNWPPMRYNSPEVRLLPLRCLCHRLRLGPRLVTASDAVKRQEEETAPKPGNDRVKPRCPPHSESSLARRATGVAAAARHALPMHRVPALWVPVPHAFPPAAAGPLALVTHTHPGGPTAFDAQTPSS